MELENIMLSEIFVHRKANTAYSFSPFIAILIEEEYEPLYSKI
jgi:hypothetical protein